MGWPEETSLSTRRYLLNQLACIFLNEADSTRDLDLRVEFNHKLQLSYLDMLKLKQELEELNGTQVDLLEEKAVRNPLRRKRIIDERVLLYAS